MSLKAKKGTQPLRGLLPEEEKLEYAIILGKPEQEAFDKWAYANLTAEAKDKVTTWLLQQTKGTVKRQKP